MSDQTSPASTAVLLLDQRGRITAANASARTLWQSDLVGEHLATLFVFEVVSTDPEFLEAQWDVILATTLDQSVTLSIQPRESEPRDLLVRLEKSLGPDGYIAVVQPPAAAPAARAASGSAASSEAGNAFALLAEKGALAHFDLNLQAGVIHYSAPWKRMLGYLDAELADTYDTWLALIHPDDSAAAPDKTGKKPVPGPRPFSVEFRLKHRLGRWVWVQCLGVQLIGTAGEVERVVGLHIDITERKEIEEASIANDSRFQEFTNDGLLGAFELDFAGQNFWFSSAWKKILGHDEADDLPATAATFAAALPAADAIAGAEAWLLARAPGQTEFLEPVRLTAKDGRSIPALLGAHRVVTRKRELTRVVGFIAALPANLAAVSGDALPPALTAEAFTALAEGLIVTDPRGLVLFANATAARLLHRPAAELAGQKLGDAFPLINRLSGRTTDDPVDRALETDTLLPLISDDALAPTVEGAAPLPVIWTARASFGPDNKPRGVVIVFRDPEEMTLTPEELVKANRFEALGLLAGGIAHDFNNLLTTILGGISIARGQREDATLNDAEKACDTAKGLTKQLLAFAKGGTGVRAVAASKQILDDAVIIATAGSSAVVTVEAPEDLNPVEVDRSQILQVFQNLLVNALQAMPPAPHIARVQLRAANTVLEADQIPGLAAGEYVEFEVRDNASGIKPEHLAKIFDPFFTTKKHGTGLGLATVLSVVRRHRGEIGVDSTVGAGTAFTVYLPRATKPVEHVRRTMSIPWTRTDRVLLMDDDEKICSLTTQMLVSLGYKPEIARNGEEAVALYGKYFRAVGRSHYDIVIMDLTVIGGMGGEECFKALKEMDPNVRAIVSTGYDNDDMNKRFVDMGFLGYLTKPYRQNDLGKVLRSVLG